MGVRLILGFSISFALLIIAPSMLTQPLSPQASPRLGDALDLLTPFVLITCYYGLFRSADDWAVEPPSGLMTAFFVVGSILFIDGHGMHLAANSIGHFLEDMPATSAYAITYFYDEVLSHYMWHLGTLVLAVVLLWRHYQPVKKGLDMWNTRARQQSTVVVASVLYGLTVALAAIEGQTVPLDLPSAVVIGSLFAYAWKRQRQLPGGPVFSFLGIGYTVTALTLLGWGTYWGRFPQFSDLGIIK